MFFSDWVMLQREKNGGERDGERRIQFCGECEHEWRERAERAGENPDAQEEGRRDLSRRQRAAGEGSDDRRVAFAPAEEVGAHHPHQGHAGRFRRLFRGGAPESAAPVHQVLNDSVLFCWCGLSVEIFYERIRKLIWIKIGIFQKN